MNAKRIDDQLAGSLTRPRAQELGRYFLGQHRCQRCGRNFQCEANASIPMSKQVTSILWNANKFLHFCNLNLINLNKVTWILNTLKKLRNFWILSHNCMWSLNWNLLLKFFPIGLRMLSATPTTSSPCKEISSLSIFQSLQSSWTNK